MTPLEQALLVAVGGTLATLGYLLVEQLAGAARRALPSRSAAGKQAPADYGSESPASPVGAGPGPAAVSTELLVGLACLGAWLAALVSLWAVLS